jgi:RNA polymerase sigma-70 factor (ECF subfamily)
VHVIEKGTLAAVDPALGRFRSFLLASVKNFLANQWDREAALRRGGGWTRVVLDPSDLERRYAALQSEGLDPERLFDRHWAHTVIDRALNRLRVQQTEAGRAREFEMLAAYLTSDTGEGRSYREVAAELRSTEPAVRAAVHRLRQRFAACLRAEIAETVTDAAAADAELRHVLSVAAA